MEPQEKDDNSAEIMKGINPICFPTYGETISQILDAVNVAHGGGHLPTGCYTYSSLNDLVTRLNEAFDNCNVSTWALEHLSR